jgi:hypothetical protein
VEELRASSGSEQSSVFVAIAIPETEHQVLEKSQFFSTRGPEANRTSKKQRTLKRTTTYVTNTMQSIPSIVVNEWEVSR